MTVGKAGGEGERVCIRVLRENPLPGNSSPRCEKETPGGSQEGELNGAVSRDPEVGEISQKRKFSRKVIRNWIGMRYSLGCEQKGGRSRNTRPR